MEPNRDARKVGMVSPIVATTTRKTDVARTDKPLAYIHPSSPQKDSRLPVFRLSRGPVVIVLILLLG